MPKVANNTIVFNTAFGSFTGDITATMMDPGNLKIVTASTTTTIASGAKAMGGALIVGGQVVVATDQSIRRVQPAGTSLGSGGVFQSVFNRVTPAVMKTWEQVAR
jgi:hypothetical protein